MEDPRIRKFAQFLIRSAVGLEKGEKILIELHGSETGLMKSLVQEAYAVGGKPFVHIFDYAVEGALVQGADAEHMEEIASYELERMRDMDAYIDIRATTNISMWHNVSDEAQKRYRQYYWGPIHLAERCNHTKWSVLRYPNDAMAQLAGVSTEEYEDFYFRACLVDYDKMGRAMQPLQDLMARTDKVRIVAPGTDISFSIKGIPSFGMHGNRNIPDGEVIVFDGHGNATLKKPDDSEIQAVYTFENGLYTIAFDGGEYVGETGLFAADGNVYYAFLFYSDKIAGAYLDCDDLSVVRLDETGNALRYNSDGRSETGRYTVLSDGLFYFESETGSSALYEICADGQVARSSFSSTYYASDFASIVFYSNGVVLFNNASAMFYSYDESSQKIYTYTPSDSSEANAYGFVAEEFEEEDGSITYTDPADNVTRTYMRFDGKYTVLEDGKGGKLEFQSDGGAEFTVDAVYTDSTGKQTQYYFLVYYGDSGVETMLACLATGALNGSVSDYLFTVNYFIEVNLTEKTFAFDSEKYIYGLTAYDYTYVELLTVYGSGLAFLFEGAYGYINVVADVADGKTVYSVSGSFNFIKDADGNPLRFADGTLSKAGFIDAQVEGFGNLFASEFVAADGNTYHLNFYLAYNRNVQQFVYIIHSCTLAEEIFRSDDGSAVYSGWWTVCTYGTTSS